MKIQISQNDFITATYPKIIILVSVFAEEKPNIITLAWHSPLSRKPPLYGISIHPSRFSHGLIRNAKEFAVNFVDWNILEKTHKCGRNSGRLHDKFKEFGLTPIKANVIKSPLIAEAYSHLECKLVEEGTFGDHTWFVGEVVSVSVNENALKNSVLSEEVLPIYYLGNDEYTTLNNKIRRKF